MSQGIVVRKKEKDNIIVQMVHYNTVSIINSPQLIIY